MKKSNLLIPLVDKAFRVLFGVFFFYILTKHLDQSDVGRYVYFVGFSLLFLTLVNLGIDGIVARVFSKTRNNKVLSSAFILKGIGYFIVVMVLSLLFYLNIIKERLYLYTFFSVFPYIFSSVEQYFIVRMKYDKVAFIGIFSTIFSFAVKLILVKYGVDVKYLVLINYLDVLVSNLILLKLYLKEQNIELSRVSYVLTKLVLKASLPLCVTGIITTLYIRVDQIIIMKFLGEESNAIYGLAVKFIEPIFLVGTVMSNYYINDLTKYSIKNNHEKLTNIFSVFTLAAFLLVLLINIFGETLLIPIFGKDYYQSVDILNILSLTIICQFWILSSAKCLIAKKLQNFALIRNCSALIINIILGLYFVDYIGLYGVALSTLLSYFVSSIISDIISKKTRFLFYIKIKSLIPKWSKQ
ncbi:oligosaccharide flippase family protein [Vibrio vulnificus]|nr:oligosaccharide flippase family protein [Vibrio vulnificus]EIZ1051346.1 oligosaccharide flippase family protein [Vibrio vulnificus]ELM0339878.1 oligosaccharide flippase family protein [Vibrio vulnificus]